MVSREPPLPIERYAELSAAIDARRARDVVLAEAGIGVDAWLIVQHYWLSLFAVEASAGRFETAKIFQQLYVAHRGRLAAVQQAGRRTDTDAPRPAPREQWPTSAAERPGSRLETSAPLLAGLGVGGGGGEGPRLTLAQWASLCVEHAMWPAALGQTLQRYGFDSASHEREVREWQWRFAQDASLHARFEVLFAQYHDWLLGAAASSSSPK